jgi:geranylgeranyl pyrophosphate synthase
LIKDQFDIKIIGLIPPLRDRLKALTRYGENVGLTFQIIDDILDVERKTEELGK